MIPDTVDQDATIYHPGSQVVPSAVGPIISHNSKCSDTYDDDSDSESEPDYFEEDFIERADDMYPSDDESTHSVPSVHVEPSDANDDGEELEDLYDGPQQPSTDLGSPDNFAKSYSSIAPPRLFSSTTKFDGVPQYNCVLDPYHDHDLSPPRHGTYDTVRSVQAPGLSFASMLPSQSSQNTSAKPRSTYTYVAPSPQFDPYNYYRPNHDADSYNSSRWDVRPAPGTVQSMQTMPGTDYGQDNITGTAAPNKPRSNMSLFSPTNPEFDTSSVSNVFGQPLGYSAPVMFCDSYSTAPSQHVYCHPQVSQTNTHSPATIAQSMKNKMNISDILEGPGANDAAKPEAQSISTHNDGDDSATLTRLQAVFADTASKIAAVEAVTSASSGKKRKADEMLAEPEIPKTFGAASNSSIEVNLSESLQDDEIAAPPPAKKSKVAEVAKIAGGAIVMFAAGGAATMTFLCSPLAEKAIEWLA